MRFSIQFIVNFSRDLRNAGHFFMQRRYQELTENWKDVE
jgi:hypothetical protein